ncbi:MAG: hypothetical protein UT64_C0027G0010 [Candidatus Falkowbacteria bacterium GW2011_GWF2_39_8]|uniref:Acyltransferase 3 domain-containing protein n=1 Tax=Candidatus Falkowbacteria bacterium GW2011_GWF2_39_8 TaxID=1618642 RepID=A0A0G0PWX7_9BACT|nr:MAG: hypothetical protein UT64_C0027G0010 [Candidatus Falkowbacteria bacterium GW2011_GWF2_39_8]
MTISINNPLLATYIFEIIFVVALLISIRRREGNDFFPASVTQELKGLAILAVVFSHIGYFLVTDHRFLYPISTVAGVGVNLFLFLSGYGLMISSLKKQYSVWQFYRHRLLKLFIPFWLALIVFFLLDSLFLKINYSWNYIGEALLGLFTHADLYQDVNSPLWYFTLILFYYLVFPLVFLRKYPWLSAGIIYLITYFILDINPDRLIYVVHLYKIHLIAFPLGMFIAGLASQKKISAYLELGKNKIANANRKIFKTIFYYFSLAVLIILVGYTLYFPGIGQEPLTEELTSIAAVLALILIFSMKKFDIKLLYWFGFYSYEIYLFHWPLLYRYDLFFKFLPAWFALVIYLAFFLALGWGLRKISDRAAEKVSV